MKIIAFWSNQLCERGTEIAMFDYAYYNQILLGNKSIILYNMHNRNNSLEVIEKFKKEFPVFGVPDFKFVDQILLEQKCDILYDIKYGNNDGQISKVCKTVIHCVFVCEQIPHGDVYASIGPLVAGNNGKYPVVPHIVNLPNSELNMRKELNIPKNAVVFGRHGGKETFNIKYVQNTVYKVAKNNPHIYFIFVNTFQFCEKLDNIIHLNAIIDLTKKVEFINTCDAMIWGRQEGETFGLSIAEFSIKNKPVIASKVNVKDKEHANILGDKALWYDNPTNLEKILLSFDRYVVRNKDWNAYTEYTPEKVMEIFKKVFID
jgi:hypothetical protein